MYILDFDRVLFNYGRFSREYLRTFRSFGVSRRLFFATYAASRKTHNDVYRHETHVRLLKEAVPALRTRELERGVAALLRRSSAYIYGDARQFLSDARKQKSDVVLVSHGFRLQEKKIRASGITRFFRKIIVTDDPDKTRAVAAALGRTDPANAVFIDDKRHITDAVKKKFPRMLVIQLVRRRRQERSTRADAVVATLAAARRVIAARLPQTPGARGY